MSQPRLLIRQRPRIVHYPANEELGLRENYGVRDERGGPFGPTGVSRQEAEAWLADSVRVIVVATLQDHGEDYGREHPLNDAGQRRCRCGAQWADDKHHADMIADRLSAAGLVAEGGR